MSTNITLQTTWSKVKQLYQKGYSYPEIWENLQGEFFAIGKDEAYLKNRMGREQMSVAVKRKDFQKPSINSQSLNLPTGVPNFPSLTGNVGEKRNHSSMSLGICNTSEIVMVPIKELSVPLVCLKTYLMNNHTVVLSFPFILNANFTADLQRTLEGKSVVTVEYKFIEGGFEKKVSMDVEFARQKLVEDDVRNGWKDEDTDNLTSLGYAKSYTSNWFCEIEVEDTACIERGFNYDFNADTKRWVVTYKLVPKYQVRNKRKKVINPNDIFEKLTTNQQKD